MKPLLLALGLAILPVVLPVEANNFVATNNVIWNALGADENSSMPIGNGDIGLNVWTEKNGDIVFLIGKSDAWSENGQLLKLGRVRVKLTPNPFTAPDSFTQTLKLESGEVQLQSGKNVAHIWVDANRPAIHVEVESEKPLEMEAKSEVWRTKSYHLDRKGVSDAGFFEFGNNPDGLSFDADTVFSALKDRVTWCHFNTNSIYPMVFKKEHLESLLSKYPDPLMHRGFGVSMKGPNLVSSDHLTLKSTRAAKSQRLDLYALTQQADSPEAWQTALNKVISASDAVSVSSARKAHQKWWTEFWDRSWVHVGGTADAAKVSQSYALQRFMTACASRGAQPSKFNGSIFTVGHDLPEGAHSTPNSHDPDFRAWGASFWNQNVRLPYWPLIATGDYDLLKPWFDMYVNALPLAKDRTRAYYNHDGGGFVETIYFWGLPNLNDFGWDNKGHDLQSEWMRYHVQGGIEVVAQMLDCYDNTQDAGFAQNTLLPMADATVTYYDQHWKRGEDGKIYLSPAQSLETYQLNAVNPTPDIAGLMSILPRLLALPARLGSDAQRSLWKKVLQDLPPLPFGKTFNGKLARSNQTPDENGKKIILPAQKYGPSRNSENPELYTVFPYRLYGVGKPDLQMARDTYNARLFHFSRCWGQDGTQSATLGLTDEAKRTIIQEFTTYGNQQFRWFWAKNNDWIPDMDNGGSAMIALQLMLMQCDDKRIQITPAWPADWTADFKLNAPFKTTVEGRIENGKVVDLKVSPKSRAKDVVIVSPTP